MEVPNLKMMWAGKTKALDVSDASELLASCPGLEVGDSGVISLALLVLFTGSTRISSQVVLRTSVVGQGVLHMAVVK